jgi:hypothetical protein
VTDMNAAMAEIIQADVRAKAKRETATKPQPRNIKRIMLVLMLGAAALGITGYYSYQDYKIDRFVERLLSEADSEHDQQVVTLYVYKQHCKTDVPVVVNKIVDRYIHARGLDDLINRKRQEIYGNPFHAGLMTMIGCPIVQGMVNSLAADLK